MTGLLWYTFAVDVIITFELFTVLKDEPEDLTHLAPTAGDACIPLENSPFDMFDEFILNDNYCSLLGDDLANASPVDSLTPDSLLLSSPEPQVGQHFIKCLILFYSFLLLLDSHNINVFRKTIRLANSPRC